jgi:HD-like signal output (HDOD) protein
LTWLSRLFGATNTGRPPIRRTDGPARATASRPTAAAESAAAGPAARPLSDAEGAFLTGLIDPPDQSLDSLPQDDRTFVAGIQRRLRTRELDLPVLPEMALRMTKMFREGAPVSEFVKLINADASLAVEVLRTANSAFYAAGRPLTSLQDAIVRIGLDRLQSVLMVAHLRGKVLKAGPFQLEADLLLELAMPVGQLATKLSARGPATTDICFMRGALLHVEHLVILGATTSLARDARRTIVPSQAALHQAFVRSGRPIRDALAVQWNLGDLLLGGEGEAGLADEYDLIRRILVCRWLRLPMPDVAFTRAGFESAIAGIAPRVPPRPEAEGDADVPLAS